MHSKEKAVREAAAAFHDAIIAARAAGFVVDWPARVDELPAIVISETADVKPDADEKPAKAKA